MMSVVALDSTSNTTRTVAKSLEIALSEFGSVLSDDERQQLQQIKGVPDASAALVFTAKLDASNSTRRGKSIGARAYSMLQSIQQFSTIVDTFISANPDIAALVWGSLKLTLLIAANITSYFESLADLFMGLNKLFPQFDEYKLLFLNSPALQGSICIFHASIVHLCKHSILLTRQPWIRKVTTDLRSKLRPQVENIHSCAKDVKKAVDLAKATSDRKEQEFQEQERKLAAKHRMQISILTSHFRKELDRTREWQMQKEQELMREKRMKLLDSLSTYAYQKNFHQTRKKRHVNTATWLFSTLEFVMWKDGKTPSVSVLTGKLGSGKTVLISSVIDHLYCEKTRSDELTTFVFPRFDDPISLNAATVLKSIIRQCLKPDDLTGEVLRQLSRFEKFDADMDIIETLFQHCVGMFSKLYIVIDALDEFEPEQRTILLLSLSFIISLPDSKAKLFLVGRRSVSMDIFQADIEAYTRETIILRQREQLGPQEQLILQDPTLARDIIEALIGGADGMFLWVDYQIIEICECTCDDEIREVLRTLPKTLGETFDRAMKRILKRGSAQTAICVFKWAAVTKRALTLDELGDALSYEPGTPYSPTGKRPSGLERITTWCENLVQLDEELQVVQFAHHSILQHFLEQPSEPSLQSFHIKLDEADHFIGEICVTYLNSNDFKTDLTRNPAGLLNQLPGYIVEEAVKGKGVTTLMMGVTQKRNTQRQQRSIKNQNNMVIIKNGLEDSRATLQLGHPFLEYASDHWLLHTHNFEEGKSITWNLLKHMLSGLHNLAKTPWSKAEFHDRAPAVYEWIREHDHFPAFLHFVSITRISSSELNNFMHHYAILGRLDYINILVELATDEEQLSRGLLYAVTGGHLEVVKRLLDAKANVNATAQWTGQTALQVAATYGHLEVVQILLDAKADINTTTFENRRTALQAAAKGGHLEVFRILLDAEANINDTDQYGWTALHIAAEGGHLEIVQKLLNAKANINATSRNGWTALQLAAEGGHLEVVQILLDAKANVNAIKRNGWTALQLAAESGHLEVVQILLDAKANVNAATYRSGSTALQAAVEGGHLEVVTLLRSFGARH